MCLIKNHVLFVICRGNKQVKIKSHIKYQLKFNFIKGFLFKSKTNLQLM